MMLRYRLIDCARGTDTVGLLELLRRWQFESSAQLKQREANALEAIMARLRRKIGPDIIRTRKGFGYELGVGP